MFRGLVLDVKTDVIDSSLAAQHRLHRGASRLERDQNDAAFRVYSPGLRIV